MRRATVLMYHRLGEGTLPGREDGEEIYAISPESFAEHLDALEASRASVVPLSEIVESTSALGDRPVALTFDDGNATDADVALPALTRRSLTAAFFISPALIGARGYMAWPDVAELSRAGMLVGAHGLDHTLLDTLHGEALHAHLLEARRLMEDRLGRRPTVLSLPGGAGGRAAFAAALECGFSAVCDSRPRRVVAGCTDRPIPRFALRRGSRAETAQALAEQRPGALLGAWLRHAAAGGLRRLIGESRYQRIRRRAAQAGHGSR
jgi:peptidoglycan/xylan/chitin deacetylase (PgdA/CDA1 family)